MSTKGRNDTVKQNKINIETDRQNSAQFKGQEVLSVNVSESGYNSDSIHDSKKKVSEHKGIVRKFIDQ